MRCRTLRPARAGCGGLCRFGDEDPSGDDIDFPSPGDDSEEPGRPLCEVDLKADRPVKLVAINVPVVTLVAAALFLQLAQIAEVPLSIACGAVRDLGPHTVPAAAVQQTG